MGKSELRTAEIAVSRTRVLRIVVDGRVRTEAAGERTAVETQHALRDTGKTVRVTEQYR